MDKKCVTTGKKGKGRLWFAAGFLAVAAMVLPYLILGKDAIVTYHDQLDGELIAYLLQAKNLFRGEILPEFMGGAVKSVLTMPAPACVVFFLVLDAFWAYVCMQVLGSLIGYVGMYLLIKEAGGDMDSGKVSFVAAVVGLLYAYLPFLPVYGLAQYGLPLLLWYLLQLKERRHCIGAYIYGAVYALNSSLVLVGFGVLGLLGLWIIFSAIWRRPEKEWGKENSKADRISLGIVAGLWGMMLALYLLENIPLLSQMLGGKGSFVSHKAEYGLAAKPLYSGFLQSFLQDGQHVRDFHLFFLAAAVLTGGICLWKKVGKRQCGILISALVCNLFLAFGAALWESGAGVTLRNKLGALGSLQLNRVLWLTSCFWYLILGCTLLLAVKFWEEIGNRKESVRIDSEDASKRDLRDLRAGSGNRVLTGLLCTVVGVSLLLVGGKVLLESNLKPNVQKMVQKEYGAISFSDYYAVGVLDQVQEYLGETTGKEPEKYRVVSLGIDPAAALYHGFYCLDGYSNNYPMEYKHTFRELLVPEFAKSEYLQDYFDTWGNRCYLFSSECPGYYTVEKGGFFFQNYQLNVEKLAQMGGRYLLSAAYIANAEEQGLTLLREEPFETAESYYRIFLYEVTAG